MKDLRYSMALVAVLGLIVWGCEKAPNPAEVPHSENPSGALAKNNSGTFKIDYICTVNCTGTWPHVYTLTSFDPTTGDFTATGLGLVDGATENVTANLTCAGVLTLTSVYTTVGAGYTITITGTVVNGKISGTATSNAAQQFTVRGGILNHGDLVTVASDKPAVAQSCYGKP